jgi:hypothetical protein
MNKSKCRRRNWNWLRADYKYVLNSSRCVFLINFQKEIQLRMEAENQLEIMEATLTKYLFCYSFFDCRLISQAQHWNEATQLRDQRSGSAEECTQSGIADAHYQELLWGWYVYEWDRFRDKWMYYLFIFIFIYFFYVIYLFIYFIDLFIYLFI